MSTWLQKATGKKEEEEEQTTSGSGWLAAQQKRAKEKAAANATRAAASTPETPAEPEAPAAPQPSTERSTPAQTGRLRPGWDVSDVARVADPTAYRQNATANSGPTFADADALESKLGQYSAAMNDTERNMGALLPGLNYAKSAVDSAQADWNRYERKLTILDKKLKDRTLSTSEYNNVVREYNALLPYAQQAAKRLDGEIATYNSISGQAQQLQAQYDTALLKYQETLPEYEKASSISDQLAKRYTNEAQALIDKGRRTAAQTAVDYDDEVAQAYRDAANLERNAPGRNASREEIEAWADSIQSKRTEAQQLYAKAERARSDAQKHSELERRAKELERQADSLMYDAEGYDALRRDYASAEEAMRLRQQAEQLRNQAYDLRAPIREYGAAYDEQARELMDKAERAQKRYDDYKYSQIMSSVDTGAKDFASKSQPNEEWLKRRDTTGSDPSTYLVTAWKDNKYAIINGSAEALADATTAKQDRSYLSQMTDEERARYNYLFNNGDTEAAEEFLKKLEPYLTARQRGVDAKWWQSYSAEHPWGASAFSVLVSPAKAISFFGQAVDLLDDGVIDQNASYNKYSNIPKDIRGAVAQKIEKSWGEVGSFGYQTAMSMFDFLYNSLITGEFFGAGAELSGVAKFLRPSLAIMGTGAAADTVIDMRNRGVDSTRSYILGCAAGLAEIITENVSLETLLNPELLADGVTKYVLKNMLAEGSEELGSDVLNWAADYVYDVISGQNESEWKQDIRERTRAGMSSREAATAVLLDKIKEAGLDALGGALSGGVMAGIGGGYHSLMNTNVAQAAQSAVAATRQDLREANAPMEAAPAPMESAPVEAPIQEAAPRAALEAAVAKLQAGEQLTQNDAKRILNDPASVQALQDAGVMTGTIHNDSEGRQTVRQLVEQYAATETNNQAAQAENATEANTAQEAPPVPQETRNTPRLTLPTRTTQTAEGAAETPRLTLPTRDTQATTEAPPVPSAEQISAFDKQAESDLVERLSKSKPGLMVDDYARSKLSDAEIQAIDETAKRLGLRVGFIDLGQLKDSNAKIYDNGVVLIEKGNTNPIGYLYGHEMGHWLQQNSPEAYNEFAEAARAADPEWFKHREEEYNTELRKLGKKMTPEEIQEEILCDYAGWLVKDEDVLNRFINQNKDKPNVLRRLYEAIKALAAKLTGRERQQANTAADLLLRAMNATEANVQNGIMSTGETRGSFGGILAQNADMEARAKAEDLHTRGNRTRERGPVFNNYVRRKTGWFKGGDGLWRFEIDDHNSSVNIDESMRQLRDNQYSETANLLYRWNHNLSLTSDEWDYVEDYLATSDEDEGVQLPSGKAQKFASGHGTIGDVLEHKELYRQYPFIATVPLKFENLGLTTLGSTSDSGITLNTSLLSDEAELRSTLLHEIQHLIQREEGFARGSNPRYWQKQIDTGMDTTRPSEVNALKEYNRIKAENPDIVRDTIRLDQIFNKNHDDYDIVVDSNGVVHTDEWVSKETGKVVSRDDVWGEYEKFRSEMEDKYGKVLDEYYDVLAALASSPEDAELLAITGPKPRSAFEMYEDTYGEAEARNVEFRARLNPEEANAFPPFTGDEDSVFLEPRFRNRSKSSMKGLNADTAPDSIAADGYPTDMKRFDDDYMTALDAGDRDTMSSMVRAAAVRAGYDSPLLMHGTAQFGFTKFDPNKVDDHISFFLTADKRTAGSYYHGPDEIREIRSVEPRLDYDTLSPERLLEEAMAVNYPLFSSYTLLDEVGRSEVLDAARSTITVMREVVEEAQQKAAVDQDTGEILSEDTFNLFDELLDAMQALASAGKREEIIAAWGRINGAINDLEILGLDTYLVRDVTEETDYTHAPLLPLYYDYDELEHAKDLLDNLTLSEALYRDYDVTLSMSPYASTYVQLKSASDIVAYLKTQPSTRQSGIYQFYCSPGKQLVIDCDNSNWNDIEVSQDIRRELRLGEYVTTRQVSRAAYDRGYDSVYFRDIRDNGGHTPWFGASDVYIYFDGKRVKSADPVTIDDNGEIIKPSERFKPVNEFRRSLKGLNADIAPESIQKYGAIPKGEKPARSVNVPKKVTGRKNERVSWTARTAAEAKATPDAALPSIEELVRKGAFSYEVQSDKAAIAEADATIKDKGWTAALADWMKDVTKGNVSKSNTAMGWALYNNAVNANDIDTAMTVLDLMVRHQRNAAQALQASRILKQLTPEQRLYGVQRSVDNLINEIRQRHGKKWKNFDIQINRDLAQAFLDAQTEEERQKALQALYKDIGSQVPATFLDKWNAWRYLAMLGNPRTHVRNTSGNTGFAPVVLAKDQVATILEGIASAVSKGKVERTKGLVLPVRDHDLVKAAWDRYRSVRDEALGESKYNDRQMENRWIEEGRTIFKFKPLELARRANSTALDVEDVWFSQPHYTYALAQYCKANGITPAQIRSGEGMDKADAYAIKEAQKATYRDTNAFSSFVSSLGRTMDRKTWVGKAASTVLEGVLPFRKTPANILARGVEYSPIGLLKSLTYDMAQVMSKDEDGNPKMSVAQMLDDVSAGLTGTGLLALGGLLAKLGILRGRGDDDKKKRDFYDLMGYQQYAITLPNGESYTLDWLAPESLPLFVGVNLYEKLQQDNGDVKMADLLSAISQISEPMLEMSMLQSLNDAFEAIGYAKENELSPVTQVLSSAVTSYLTQAIPTLGGQIERTGENVRMTTYRDKNKWLTPDVQYTLGKISTKIPGWDYNQIPYIDAWGRKEVTGDNWGGRALENMVSPGYTDETNVSDMEKELERLYDADPDKYKSVLPTSHKADKYITFKRDGEDVRIDLTGEQYVDYAITKGQTAYNLMTDLVKTDEYNNASDDDKAKMVASVYDYAATIAKGELMESLGETNEDYTRLKEKLDKGADILDMIALAQEIKNADEENNVNSSYDTLEKLDAVEALGLPEAKAEPLLEQQLSEGQWEKYNTLKDAGVNYDTRLDIMRKYSELNANEEMDSGTRALEFAYYVDGLNLTGKQTQLVKDTYKFWTQVPAEAKRYETFKQADLSDDKAKHITEVLGALEPLPGKEYVTDMQSYRAIESDDILTNAEKINAIGSIMGPELKTEQGNPTQWAKFNTALNNGQSLSQAIDLYENGRLDEFEKWTTSAAKGENVKWDVYDKFLKDTSTITGEKDASGKTISGSLKSNVCKYIDSLDLTIDQKKALLKDYNKTYKDDYTWHNGSYGGGSGKGKTYAPADTSKLQLPPSVRMNEQDRELWDMESHGGNVNLRTRKTIPVTRDNIETVRGWGMDSNVGDYMTVASQTYRDGNRAIVVTPILPDGTLLTQKELDAYMDSLRGSDDYADADDRGIILGVFDDGNWQQNLRESDAFAERIHELHEEREENRKTSGLKLPATAERTAQPTNRLQLPSAPQARPAQQNKLRLK